MSKLLICNALAALLLTAITTLCQGFLYQAEGAVGGGDSSLDIPSRSLQPLNLTLRGALAAAVENNPDVLLYKERIEAARGQVQTQLGAMLPIFPQTSGKPGKRSFGAPSDWILSGPIPSAFSMCGSVRRRTS